MPVEPRSLRDRSAVGRFPAVTLGFGDDTEDEKEDVEEEEEDSGKENACSRWLRRVCPCCYPEVTDDDDIENTVVTGVEETEKEDVIKPQPGDNQLDELLLRVQAVDLMKTRTGQNRVDHHTDLYQTDSLVVRRGRSFQMWITLSRPFDPDTDKLRLELTTGPLPTVSKGTHVTASPVGGEGRWATAVVQQDDCRMKLEVTPDPEAVIGRYRLVVKTSCPSGQFVSPHDPDNDVYVLFNPWCEDDGVFLDSEAERVEYVLNDVGRIYYGTKDQIGVRTWNYGQFDEGILAACLFVLEKSGTPPSGWKDPINVVRVISAMVNSQGGGVLLGSWTGDYSGGTSPTVWSGSVEILRAYHQNHGSPVKYGQCWIFAGVVTTVLRCLGVPSRTVTNFESAHDTDVSLTTDVYLDENLEPLEHLNTDSIWNFHVWNDCWMSRPDLPAGNGGWQAVDATPQETSQGTFRCGPASLAALRHGQVDLKYDSTFVFAEVNSDKIYWQRNVDGTFSQIYSEKKKVGHSISTKAVGSDQRHDITHLYKHPEGTEQERIAVETACSHGSKAAAYSSPTAEDVSVEVTMDGEGPTMGNDADLTLVLRNSSAEQRRLLLHSQAAVMYYTGVHKATVRKDTTEVELLPNEVKSLEWTLLFQDYRDQLIDQAALMLTLSGRVKETQQVVATQFSFRLRTPNLDLKPLGRAVVGQKLAVEISFTNPLPQTLKDVIFHVEGLGLRAGHKIPYGDIASRASVSLTEHLVPALPGPRKLTASLDCKQLTQVHGVADITVEEQSNGIV